MSDYLKHRKKQSFSRKCHLLLAGANPPHPCPSGGHRSHADAASTEGPTAPLAQTIPVGTRSLTALLCSKERAVLSNKDSQNAAVGLIYPWKS